MSGELPWTTWYGDNRKRWPMTIGLWLGVVFTVYSVAVGYGYRLAQERLPVSRAAVIERNQPPVSDERNAAVLYDQATKVFVPWKSLAPPETFPSSFEEQEQQKPQDLDRLRSEDWRDEATYAADGPLRTFLRANEDAARLALEGMARSEIDWGIPSEDYPAASLTRLTNARPLIRLMGQRALASAHDGDWPATILHLGRMERGAGHVRQGIGIMPYLIGTSLSTLTWTTACNCLAVPGATIDEQVLSSLRALALEAAKPHLLDLHRALVDESHMGGHVMDQVGCGDFSRITNNRATGGLVYAPRPMSSYSAVYPWDRSYFDDLMHSAQEAALAAAENRRPHGLMLDPEIAVRDDPRLVYSRIFGKSLSSMLLPISGMLRTMEVQRQDKWRMLIAAIDLNTWMLRTGRLPTSLDEVGIEPGLLKDPFAKDQLLQWRLEADGLLRLWSVGKNRKDDTTTPPTGRYARSDDVSILIRLPASIP